MHTFANKIAYFLIIILFVLVLPGTTKVESATVEELQAQINVLIEQIEALEAQLKTLQGGTPHATNIEPIPSNYTFKRNLKLGDRGEDVKVLQRVLNTNKLTMVAQNGLGSPGQETTYYGSLTKDAVKRFQELNFELVLLPHGLLGGTGYFGTSSRELLNELIASKSGLSTSLSVDPRARTPEIYSVHPAIGFNKRTIILKGRNFDKENNTVYVSADIYRNVKSPDGRTITLYIDSSVVEAVFKGFDLNTLSRKEKDDVRYAVTGRTTGPATIPHYIVVVNDNGESDKATYQLQIFK